jgi:NADH-quinone oxidoreductase subunit M
MSIIAHLGKRLVSAGHSNTLFIVDLRLWGLTPYVSLSFFGSLLLCLSFFVGLIALVASDTRIKMHSTPLFVYFQFFITIAFGFVTCQNLFILFLCYELLLLPSFLFVLFGSYTGKAVQASLYFVI